MNIVDVVIGGNTYPAAMSLRVLDNLETKTGKPATTALRDMLNNIRVSDTVWLLRQMIAAGVTRSHAAIEPPSEDELLDNLDSRELAGLVAEVMKVLKSAQATVEAAPPKNPKAM